MRSAFLAYKWPVDRAPEMATPCGTCPCPACAVLVGVGVGLCDQFFGCSYGSQGGEGPRSLVVKCPPSFHLVRPLTRGKPLWPHPARSHAHALQKVPHTSQNSKPLLPRRAPFCGSRTKTYPLPLRNTTQVTDKQHIFTLPSFLWVSKTRPQLPQHTQATRVCCACCPMAVAGLPVLLTPPEHHPFPSHRTTHGTHNRLLAFWSI